MLKLGPYSFYIKVLLVLILLFSCLLLIYLYKSNSFTGMRNELTGNADEELSASLKDAITFFPAYYDYNPKMGEDVRLNENGKVEVYKLLSMSSGEITRIDRGNYILFVLTTFSYGNNGKLSRIPFVVSVFEKEKLSKGDVLLSDNLSAWLIRAMYPGYSPDKRVPLDEFEDVLSGIFVRGSVWSFTPLLDNGLAKPSGFEMFVVNFLENLTETNPDNYFAVVESLVKGGTFEKLNFPVLLETLGRITEYDNIK